MDGAISEDIRVGGPLEETISWHGEVDSLGTRTRWFYSTITLPFAYTRCAYLHRHAEAVIEVEHERAWPCVLPWYMLTMYPAMFSRAGLLADAAGMAEWRQAVEWLWVR